MPWWAFFAAGAVLVVALPWLVLRRRPWAARILALGPAGKALVLCWRLGRGESTGRAFDAAFAAVAAIAAVLLARAGWLDRAGSDEGGRGPR